MNTDEQAKELRELLDIAERSHDGEYMHTFGVYRMHNTNFHTTSGPDHEPERSECESSFIDLPLVQFLQSITGSARAAFLRHFL